MVRDLSDRVNPREGLRLSMVIHSAITLTGTLTTWLGWYDRAACWRSRRPSVWLPPLHSPMRLALVPLLVTREALPSAVGYSAMSFNIARMVGPALGAALVAQVNVSAAWLVAMMMFMVSFWGCRD